MGREVAQAATARHSPALAASVSLVVKGIGALPVLLRGCGQSTQRGASTGPLPTEFLCPATPATPAPGPACQTRPRPKLGPGRALALIPLTVSVAVFWPLAAARTNRLGPDPAPARPQPPPRKIRGRPPGPVQGVTRLAVPQVGVTSPHSGARGCGGKAAGRPSVSLPLCASAQSCLAVTETTTQSSLPRAQ